MMKTCAWIIEMALAQPWTRTAVATHDDDHAIPAAELPATRAAAAGGNRDASYRLWQH